MELVTLLGEDGRPSGTALKSAVHSASTPLHLAFSCYVLDDRGRVLVTRRALSKRTWPGTWTNSFCGHPAPEESMIDAVRRRARQELGIDLHSISVVLPHFRYRAVDASGIVENEICPVHVAVIDGALSPDPSEVMEWEWLEVDDLMDAVRGAPFAFSPWMAEQLPLLKANGF
jgi:isopentenyl-diphosphate delta-isomerase